MEDLESMRYKIINSMIKTYIEQEKKFFERCFSLINNFFNNMHCLEQNLPYQKSTYDPMKYTRAGKIMEGVDANSLPEIKMKDKYSNNSNKTNNIQRANSCVNNNSSNLGNNNNLINKKFSFEDYKMRKASLDNSNRNINNNNNNVNNFNDYSNNIKEDNNKNDNQNNNPYSYEAYKRRTQSLGNNKRPQINNNSNSNSNSNNNYYNNNLNLVMSSIIGEENTLAKNPFHENISNNRKNPYSSNFNSSNNNPFELNNNNKNSSNEIHNPYSNIFKSSSNNNNNINNMFNSAFGNKGTNQQNDNDNKRYRKPQGPYNFGF